MIPSVADAIFTDAPHWTHLLPEAAVTEMRPTEDLLALVGAWAKANHPEKYQATIAQVAKPATFRKYLLRLLEVRCAAEPLFVTEVPVSLLDETAIRRTLRIRSTGDTLVVGGPKAAQPTHLTWTMLDALPEDFSVLVTAIRTLDLELIP